MEVRLDTNVRRKRPLIVYQLEASVSVVACGANGVAKDGSFNVSLYKSENNKDKQPFSANIRYKRCSGGTCSAPTEKGNASTASVDTGKSAGSVFDSYVIEAYEKTTAAEKVLAVLTIPTVRDGSQGPAGNVGPMLVPNGSWDSKRKYRSTDSYKIFVERNKLLFVLHKLNVDCMNVDPATDVNNEYWRLMDYVEYVFIEAMVANFGKIASTVYSGDYMLSQYGVDAQGNPIQSADGFKSFTPDMASFIPNILLNMLTGYAHFGHGNLKVNADGSVEMVGSFSTGNKGNRIVLDPVTRSLKMIREDNTTALEIVFSSGEGVIWSEIRMSGHRGSQVLIDSIGNVRMTSTTGDRCDFETTEGIEFTHDGETLRYPSFIQCQDISSSTHVINDLTGKNVTFYRVINNCTISLPDSTKSKGRCLRFKNLRAVVNFQDNPKRATLYPSNGMTPVDVVTTDAASTYEWYCDGRFWYMYFCK